MSSCQIAWNFNDYKIIQSEKDGYTITDAKAPCELTGVKNDTLDKLIGGLHVENDTVADEKSETCQEEYDCVFFVDNKVVGSLYVVTGYEQPKGDGFKTSLKNVQGTVSCKGLFSEFNNGIALIEFNNETGERCITLYAK